MTFKHLDRSTISRIAAAYGFAPSERIVIEHAEQADGNHGTVAPRPNWGTDASGRYVASKLLDGYLSQMAHEYRCDSLAARDFERNAY